ncbi:Glycosyltransferase involved in cell wall bisynthesis [Lentibacillus persicus]|uniref:Glycosyltransferase involved in cell wall bisynthesis n=1 Tax=Lentibacillus persicus TaxID=640948 RepID=A0A1I1UHB1_9BACI|nr:glycosyltransferase family 1 protein [Lentibacillus persicus]SFD67320.1 Glycosyltransferase involved in cell wall bisynthesis [Lentibacillus persicus]
MGSPLRILHAVVNMNRGGAETLIMNLYRNIDRSKVQFDFLTCKPGVFDAEIKQMGGTVHRIPYVTEAGHKGFNRALKQFFRQHPAYTIIHAHMDKMSGLVLKAAKEANVPVRIAHSHNTESEGGLLSKTYKWYAGQYIKSHATHQYACSHAAASWLFNRKAEDVFILKNGIEPEKFRFSTSLRKTLRKELQLTEDEIVLVHIGRFAVQKNHLWLLDMIAQLKIEIPDIVLLLVGDGPLRPQIEAKISALNLEKNVRMLGVRKDIHALLHASDVFVFPSLHEGLPVTLVEAQGAGLPCLVSHQITTEADMKTGLVQHLPITDPEIWVQQILRMIANLPERRISQRALAERGYDITSTAKTTQKNYLILGENAL